MRTMAERTSFWSAWWTIWRCAAPPCLNPTYLNPAVQVLAVTDGDSDSEVGYKMSDYFGLRNYSSGSVGAMTDALLAGAAKIGATVVDRCVCRAPAGPRV